MRAILLLGIMVVLVPLALFAPFTGILSFIWMAYTRPHEWAYVNAAQYSLMIAIATIIGYLIFELPRRPPKLKANVLLILLMLQYTFAGYLLAYSPEYAQAKYIEMMKILVVALLVATMTDSENRIRWVLLVSLGSIGLLSLRSFFGVLWTGGARIYGPGGLYEDNNDFAILLDLALPMLLYFAQTEARWWMRYLFYLFTFSAFITIIFTYSRGGFLGLCAALIFLAIKSRHKIIGLIGVAVLGIAFVNFAPKQVLDRINTIKTADQEDASAQGRLKAWAVCLKIAADKPLTGVGVRNIMLVYGQYGDPAETKVAHNAYLQLVADCGVPAMLIFLGLLYVSYRRLGKARKILSLHNPQSKIIKYTHGMQVGMVGYMVSAFFASKEDVELLFTVVALAVSCMVVAREAEKEAEIEKVVEAASPLPLSRPLDALG